MKNILRKILLLIVIAAVSVGMLSGCGGNENEKTDTTSEIKMTAAEETSAAERPSSTEMPSAAEIPSAKEETTGQKDTSDGFGYDRHVVGIGGSDNTMDDFTMEPQIMLTFKINETDVETVLLKKGGESRTFTVPDTFCLAADTVKVKYWVPIDLVSFTQAKLYAGEEVTLTYETAKDMFGVKFEGTVIKMAGRS